MNIFRRTLNEREKKAGLQDVNKDKKQIPKEDKKPTQADFFYGSASDLKKKKGK